MNSYENTDYEPHEILEAARSVALNLLPEKSRHKYEVIYRAFMDWCLANKTNSFSENVLLVYFETLSQRYKSSSLWTIYSMLRSTLDLNHGIKIENYAKLRAFLKRRSEGYQAKKAKTLDPEQIKKFICEAPDEKYLATKVAVIMGLMGACRANELYAMTINDFQDLNSAVLLTVPNTKTKVVRKFTVTGPFYHIYKKYAQLRPENITGTTFFLNFQNGRCTVQRIGINKFGGMGKEVAKFLQLSHPELYTVHCFRRISATLLVDAGGDLTALKRHGGWRSTSVAEGYIDESIKNKMDTADKILGSVIPGAKSNRTTSTSTITTPMTKTAAPSTVTSSTTIRNETATENINFGVNSVPAINFTNCSDITINFVSNTKDN